MPTLTLEEMAQATGGEIAAGDAARTVDSYVIDSRRIDGDAVFFALPGERTDGHRYLGEAAANGAVAAVVERYSQGEEAPPCVLRVGNVERALTALARHARDKLSDARRIAITGSNGKTTTKELLAAGLAESLRVHRTPGNLNNHLGVPLSLLACPDDAEVMVLELAMSGYGEIAALTELVDPHIGLITNVRAVHLEYFDSLDGIAAAKGELFAVMSDDATAVYNVDNTHIRVQVTRHVGPRVSFGRAEGADVRILELVNRFDPGSSFVFRCGEEQHTVHLSLGGAHSAFNALAALAAVHAIGAPLAPAIAGMQRIEPTPGRGRLNRLRGGIVVVDDTYNSSPAALASVLETLRITECRGRKVLVIGDMLELGAVEGALHREAGKRAATCGVELLFSVGKLARQAAESARRSGVPEVHHYNDARSAADAVPDFLRDDDLVVVKGSRGVHLGQIVRRLNETIGAEEQD